MIFMSIYCFQDISQYIYVSEIWKHYIFVTWYVNTVPDDYIFVERFVSHV